MKIYFLILFLILNVMLLFKNDDNEDKYEAFMRS